MHEMLHMYYPQATEETIIQAEPVFEIAFRCYDTLQSSQPQRDFFIRLCKDNDKLRRWAGLPKFDSLLIQTYEKKLLGEQQNKPNLSGMLKEKL